MFKDEYQDYMSEVRPENSLVESMVEAQRNQRSQRTVKPARAVRVAAAALCGLLVFSGGTIAVDAATGGGVQRLLRLKDSISVGEVKTEFVLTETEENYDNAMEDNSMEMGQETVHHHVNSMESKIDEDGNVTTVITSSDDAPVFHCYISSEDENTVFQCAGSLKDCVTEEDYALTVYVQLEQMFNMYVRNNKKMCEWIVEELAQLKQEIGSGTDMQDGCAAGVQLMIDDLKSNYDGTESIVKIHAVDLKDEDGDGDRTEVVGLSLVRIDFNAWKEETERTGKTEFKVETFAGVPGTYRFEMFSYGPEAHWSCEPAVSYRCTMVE